MKLNLKKNTPLAFREDRSEVVLLEYPELLCCPPECTTDHDCFTEPYVAIRRISYTSLPLSMLETIFDKPYGNSKNSLGRPYNPEGDLEP